MRISYSLACTDLQDYNRFLENIVSLILPVLTYPLAYTDLQLLQVVLTLYFLAALGRVVSGAAVAYAGKNDSKTFPYAASDFLLCVNLALKE